MTTGQDARRHILPRMGEGFFPELVELAQSQKTGIFKDKTLKAALRHSEDIFAVMAYLYGNDSVETYATSIALAAIQDQPTEEAVQGLIAKLGDGRSQTSLTQLEKLRLLLNHSGKSDEGDQVAEATAYARSRFVPRIILEKLAEIATYDHEKKRQHIQASLIKLGSADWAAKLEKRGETDIYDLAESVELELGRLKTELEECDQNATATLLHTVGLTEGLAKKSERIAQLEKRLGEERTASQAQLEEQVETARTRIAQIADDGYQMSLANERLRDATALLSADPTVRTVEKFIIVQGMLSRDYLLIEEARRKTRSNLHDALEQNPRLTYTTLKLAQEMLGAKEPKTLASIALLETTIDYAREAGLQDVLMDAQLTYINLAWESKTFSEEEKTIAVAGLFETLTTSPEGAKIEYDSNRFTDIATSPEAMNAIPGNVYGALTFYESTHTHTPKDRKTELNKHVELLAKSVVKEVKNLRAEEQYGQAITLADRMLQLDPTNFEVTYYKGTVLLEENELESAINCFEKCLELKPGHRNTKTYLDRANLAFSWRGSGIDDVYQGES